MLVLAVKVRLYLSRMRGSNMRILLEDVRDGEMRWRRIFETDHYGDPVFYLGTDRYSKWAYVGYRSKEDLLKAVHENKDPLFIFVDEIEEEQDEN